MYRVRLVCFSFLAVLFVLFPVVKPGEYGAYNTFSGLAYCSNQWACLHEIGHALDRDAGWISQSPEFVDALRLYILTDKSELTIYVLSVLLQDDDKPAKKEVYAYLFQQANGQAENMPEIFRKFYNWELARKYMDKLNGGRLYLLRS